MISSRVALGVLAAVGVLVLWYLHDALLLVFAGSLLALLLRASAERVASLLRVPVVLAVWIVVFTALALSAAFVTLLGNAAALQLTQLRDTLPAAIRDVVLHLHATPVGTWIAANLPNASTMLPESLRLFTRATGLVSGALGAVVVALIVLFIGVAAALEPALYARGFVQLFPAGSRRRIRDVLSEIGRTLRTWLLARLLTMSVTALLVTLGLSALHVPLAAGLGMLAGVLAFVPNIGAIVAATPAVLLAFLANPKSALAVIVMYVFVHLIDDFVAAPLIERQVVKLPPALTLVAQVILGIGMGALGVTLAAPLVACALVVVRMLWVEDVAERTGGSPAGETAILTHQAIKQKNDALS